MNCKFCNAELPQGTTVCPSCGKDNAEDSRNVISEEKATISISESAEAKHIADMQTEEFEDTAETEELSTETMPDAGQTGSSKAPAVKLWAIILAVAALLAVLITAIVMGMKENNPPASAGGEPTAANTIPQDGNPKNETCKGTYTVSDEQAKENADKIVATMGDKKLTNSELQVYYWMQVYTHMDYIGEYAHMYGLDYNKPLDVQKGMSGITWQQQFLKAALESWQRYEAMSDLARKHNLELEKEDQEFLENLKKSTEEAVKLEEFENMDQLLAKNLGAGVSFEDYYTYTKAYLEGFRYYDYAYNQLKPTDPEIEKYFNEHEKEYADRGLLKEDRVVDVRHILIQPKNGTAGETGITYTDEAWNACQQEAQKLLDQWIADGAKEEAFAKLANEHSADPGSQFNGGLYEGVSKDTNFVPEFKEWCMDASRKPGDYGLVKTSHGYHIMYFSKAEAMWTIQAKKDLISGMAQKMLEKIAKENPMEVSYSDICLASVELNQKA